MQGAPSRVEGDGVQEVYEAAHHVQVSVGQQDEEEEEVVEWRKRMRPKVVILVPGPSRVVIGLQLDNAMWVLMEWMSKHLSAIAHEVKQIVDNVKDVWDSRRAKVRPQAGVQMEKKETVEAGVEAEEGGEKGSEDGDKDGEGEKGTEE